MREIKFRAWDESDDLMYQNVERGIPFDDGSIYQFSRFIDATSNDDYHKWIIMQFTGLKDKNGKEIYEGDIVKKYNEVNETYGFDFYQIYWGNCAFVLLATDIKNEFGGYLLYKTSEKLEVIGNIYENPELLEA